jgi:hypothetical protein
MTIQFLPFSIRGAGALPPARVKRIGSRRLVEQPITVVAGERGETVPSAPVALLGPADVVGIDPTQIVRRTPQPGDASAEANHLAAIEFAHPDLPWLFTPDSDHERPRPWLMLVVVPDTGPGTIVSAPGAPNPTLTIDGGELPDPREAAAWAHVQVSVASAAAAQALLANPSPGWRYARSRLLASRRLRPGSHVACVVPVFEAGRLAGLGLPVPGDLGDEVWDRRASVDLPVYDAWRFTTVIGDFEALATRLEPIEAGGRGQRGVAVDPVAARLTRDDAPPLSPDVPAAVRQVPTAMAASDLPGALAPGDDGDAQARGLRARLKHLLDVTAAADDDPEPIVGPPLYGQWHAAVSSLDGRPEVVGALVVPPAASPQAWIADLNADPEVRIAAGLGARLVQRDQEELMAEAWAQLDPVLEANRRIRWTQVAAAATSNLHERVCDLPEADALRVVAPALPDLLADGGFDSEVVQPALEATNVPPELLSPAFVHAARYAASAVGGSDPPAASSLVQVAVEALDADASPEFVPERFTASAELDIARVLRAVEQAGLADVVVAPESPEAATASALVARLGQADVVAAADTATLVDPTVAGGAAAPDRVAAERLSLIADARRSVHGQLGLGAPDSSRTLPALSTLRLATGDGPHGGASVELAPAAATGLPPLERLDAGHAAALAMRALEPAASYETLLGAEQQPNADAGAHQRSALHPIAATPSFGDPVVERLRRLDPEWVLGGVGRLRPESICVMAANRRFVEALLVGANHEMIRELRWRGYPVDPRGSCFRRFWPTVAGANDVGLLNEWRDRLGHNEAEGAADRGWIVVVIKGELLRRYPGTIVTVELGSLSGDRFATVRSATERFRGRLDPDVTYLAFAVDPGDELHAVAGDQRWYVSLRQPVDEPRFGLDEAVANGPQPNDPASPDGWTWQGLSPSDPDLLPPDAVAVGAQAGSSAQLAANLFQRPFRLLLAAGDFLPGPR